MGLGWGAIRGLCRHVAVFATTFVGVLGILGATMRPDPAAVGRPVLGEKLRYYESLDTKPDIVLVGNSLVYRTVNTLALDDELARRGCPTTSYNLGIPALSMVEVRTVLDTVLADEDRPLLVLGDLSGVELAVADMFDLRHAAFIELSDLGEVNDSWARVGELTATERLSSAAVVVGSQIPVGSLSFRLFGSAPAGDDWDRGHDPALHRGYRALEDETRPGFERRRTRFLDSVESGEWADDLETKAANLAKLEAEFHERLYSLELVGDRADVVFMLEPNLRTGRHRRLAELLGQETGRPVVNLSDPDLVPGLDDPSSWFDSGHVSEPVAATASLRLAEFLCVGGQLSIRVD